MILPPGVSEQDFRAALDKFAQIVGKEWVFVAEEDIKLYTDAYSPLWGQPEDRKASAAVAPTTTEQVQAIMRVCNEYRIPIFAFSTGKNLGYGGASPIYNGSVVLDLKRMNKILEVNEERHYAIVEPGVTLFDLYRHIQQKGYKLSVEMMDPAWGSVIGNALDHGCAHTSTYGRDRFHDHCGMEVVLPTGDLVTLGSGAMEGSEMFADFHYGFGPWADGIFSQSNFGVVTKMGFQLRPEWEAYQSGNIIVPKFEDLQKLIDFECHVTHSGIANGMTHWGSPLQSPELGAGMKEMMKFMGRKELQKLLKVKGRPDSAKLEAYGKENHLGFWNAHIKFHGPKEVIKAQWEYCKAKAKEMMPNSWAEDHHPLVTFPLSKEAEAKLNTDGHAEKVHLGIPSLNRFAMQAAFNDMRSKPGAESTGHLFFAPMLPKKAEAILKAQEVFYNLNEEFGIPNMPGTFGRMPNGWFHRSLIFLMAFNVTKNEKVNRNEVSYYKKCIKEAAKHGWGEYRTHGIFQDEVMATYNKHNHGLLAMHEKIKDALDPNGVLAAGKSGIWPAHMPEKRARVRNI